MQMRNNKRKRGPRVGAKGGTRVAIKGGSCVGANSGRIKDGTRSNRPVSDVVRQLVELAHAPVGQARPAACPYAAGMMVKLLSIAHEEVDEQKEHEEGGDEQVADCHAPAHQAGSCHARAIIRVLQR